MHESISLEDRVASLEQDVAVLKHQLAASRGPSPTWLDSMTGSMKEFPEFEEVLRLGAEWRKSQVPSDEP